jgi:hyperosmotically inducible periplasmic protein
MRKNSYTAAALAGTLCVILLAPHGAAFAQQSGANSQMSSENLSPQAQEKLIRKIQSAIIKLPYFGVFDNIAFQLQGRTVILLGSVTSEHSQTKQDAERAVKKVEGVQNVVNNIQVLPPGPLDARLRREVYNAIYNYGPLFIYSNDKNNPPIRIIVSAARVTLEGQVNTEADKNLCTIRANQVPGVLSVTNNLRVVKG